MINKNDIEFINKSMPFLKQLDKDDYRFVMTTISKSTFGHGETIINKEKECNGIVILKSGELRAFFESEDGKEIMLYRLLSGDICILTASCVLKKITFEVALNVEKESEVYFIPAAVWANLSEKNIAVKEFSMDLVSERFSEVMWVMEQIISKNMGQRVSNFLMEQSALDKTQTLTLTHDAIAKNLGTAREVISRILKYLENDGMLRLSRGQIILTDIKKLKEMSF